jgi:hypothetical protein
MGFISSSPVFYQNWFPFGLWPRGGICFLLATYAEHLRIAIIDFEFMVTADEQDIYQLPRLHHQLD